MRVRTAVGAAVNRALCAQATLRYWAKSPRSRYSRSQSPIGARASAFVGYADHMESQAFAEAVRSLSTLPARVALMCAEAEPTHCHRQLLADWLTIQGVLVGHIVDGGAPRRHELTAFARVAEARLVYDLGQRCLF